MKNRLVALMGEKQARENKPVSAAIIARETGLSRQAIHKWIHNDITQFNAETIQSLCEYFDCEVGDLLYIDRSTNGDN